MSDAHERPNVVPWPPIIFLTAAIVALALDALYPAPWLGKPLSEFVFALGVAVAGGGLAFIISAVRTLQRGKTTILPTKGSSHLVTGGSYALTRNPIYLGVTMLLLGAGLMFGQVWFFPAALIAAFLVQKLSIEPEERHLESRFGKHYRDYRKRIRRWF